MTTEMHELPEVGEIVVGTIKRVENHSVTIDLGRAEAIIKRDQMIPREQLRPGDRLRSYIVDVSEETRGPQIFLSRASNEFLAALFTLFGSLVSMAFVSDLSTALIYAIIFGLNNAFNITLFGYMWPRYFGRKNIGSIQGTGQMIGVVGASLGPLPLGIAFDLFGVYQIMLLSLASLPIVAGVLTQFLIEPPSAYKDKVN